MDQSHRGETASFLRVKRDSFVAVASTSDFFLEEEERLRYFSLPQTRIPPERISRVFWDRSNYSVSKNFNVDGILIGQLVP